MLVICHYGEIALKGKNRKFFEEKLVDNIKQALIKEGFLSVKRISGRILIEFRPASSQKQIKEKLEKVFGLVHFSFVKEAAFEIGQIKTAGVEVLKQEQKEKKFASFCVRASRSDKSFVLTSQEINEQVGELAANSLKLKVDLEKPDITLFIEIVENKAYLFTEKIMASGGLPAGVSGKAICLLSGGIDSPVAAYLAMKRGVEVVFLHLDNTSGVSSEKAKKQIQVLSQFQGGTKFYLLPFTEMQKSIFEKVKPELVCVLCKRMMIRIACEIAEKENCLAIVTGENLGQVASQTLPNMAVIEQASVLPVLKPLLCFDKQETIEIAKKIGAYSISILAEQSYCQDKLPKHPATKAVLEIVEQEEKKLKVAELLRQILNNIKILQI